MLASARPTKTFRSRSLRAAGCDVIRAEKQSGTTTQGREGLSTVLDFIGKGDVLLVEVIPILRGPPARARSEAVVIRTGPMSPRLPP